MDNSPSPAPGAPEPGGHWFDMRPESAERPAAGPPATPVGRAPAYALPGATPAVPQPAPAVGEVVSGEVVSDEVAPGGMIRAEVISTGLYQGGQYQGEQNDVPRIPPAQQVPPAQQIPPAPQVPAQYQPGVYQQPPAPQLPAPQLPAPQPPAPQAPGQYMPAQYQQPPAQYQPGQYQQPQYQPGQYAPNQYQQPQYQPGQYQPNQYQQPQYQPGQYQPGQYQPGQYPPGQYAPNQYPQISPYPGYQTPQYPPLPPARKSRGPMIAAIGGGLLVLVLCACFLGFAFNSDGSDTPSVARPSASTVTKLPATATDDQRVQAALDAQGAALLRGDQAGFLAAVDPAKSSAVSAYKRLYHNLIQLHVKVWKATSASLVTLSGGTAHTFTMSVRYCFNSTSCDGVRASLKVSAQKKTDGTVRFESLAAPSASPLSNQPLPWEVSTLTAVSGKRVVLAASKAWASRLDDVLPVAEKAAAAADAYAKWGTPTNYVIYLASSSEGKTWYHGELKNVDGVSYTISPTDIQMVIMMPFAAEEAYAGPGGLNAVIQHEMGHVVTLWSLRSRVTDHDDFIEGIAEYISYTGHTTWSKYRIYDTRSYIRRGKWNNKCYLTKQIVDDDVLTSSAAYGIGYLTIRYLAEKYGKDKMLNFWGAYERDGLGLDAAAKQTFSTSWSSVNRGCVSYVRNAVNA